MVLPKATVSYIDSKFTSNIWKGLFEGFGTILNMSTSHHPQIDGQTEIVNQVIEDMLRMYVMDRPSKWEYYLHLVDDGPPFGSFLSTCLVWNIIFLYAFSLMNWNLGIICMGLKYIQ